MSGPEADGTAGSAAASEAAEAVCAAGRERTTRPSAMARRIAQRPSFALKLAKESVNQTLEAQGQWTALRSAFSLQHLAHAHNRIRFGIPVDPGTRAKDG